MDKLMECSKLDCMLMGMAVVLVLCLVFKHMKEGFDTSLATRSQVGDSTNLDTINGQGGFLPGNVYDCNAPILMVQPDNAWTWGDSKNYIADESLAHLHPDQYEAMTNEQRQQVLNANPFKPVFLPRKEGFDKRDASVQYTVFNKSGDIKNRTLGKEGFAEHLKRTNEGFDTHNSESTLAAVMQGYQPTSVLPQAVVNKLEKMPFLPEMLRGGANYQKK